MHKRPGEHLPCALPHVLHGFAHDVTHNFTDGVALGVAFLGEPFRASLLLAMVLILAGVALSQWGALTRLFAKKH